MINVRQYYEYTLDSESVRVFNMLELRSIILVWQSFEYSSGSQYTCQELSIYQGYLGFCVNCILKIHGILNVLNSEYAK